MAIQKEKLSVKQSTTPKLPFIFLSIGTMLFSIGILILILTFAPLIIEEARYALRQLFSRPSLQNEKILTQDISPIDKNFGIIIPKLAANARIIANVDPFDTRAYQVALSQGVAHARGTAYPGTMGNVFLFAHSSEDFYNALRYNSIFYLLNKLETGDQMILYYNSVKFTYVVTGQKFVDPKDISYLELKEGKQTLTLMTCWPAGTTLKRLLVFAKLQK